MADKLALYIDTAARPNWRFKPVDGTPLGTDLGTLPQFQRAAAIRETFFPTGNAISIKLEFKPVDMDNELKSFILDVDGQLVRYAHGPQIPMPVVWPGPARAEAPRCGCRFRRPAAAAARARRQKAHGRCFACSTRPRASSRAIRPRSFA